LALARDIWICLISASAAYNPAHMEILYKKSGLWVMEMGFVFFAVASCIAVLTFYSMSKSLPFLENTVILLVVLALNINVSWIIGEELHYIQMNRDPLLYTAFLLNRSVLLPLIYVIWLNILYSSGSDRSRWMATLGCTGLVLGLNGMAEYFQIYIYAKWNVFNDLLVVLFLQAVIYMLHRLAANRMVAEVGRI
jgi:hypothetical protein